MMKLSSNNLYIFAYIKRKKNAQKSRDFCKVKFSLLFLLAKTHQNPHICRGSREKKTLKCGYEILHKGVHFLKKLTVW